jgi:hypothetical protein
MNAPLTLHDYWETVGTDKLREVCAIAGTSFAYYKLMAYHFKGCSPEMMERLEAACAQVTPGVAPDYVLCTRPSLIAQGAQERRERAAGTKRARRPLHRERALKQYAKEAGETVAEEG